ncbi:putative reverse transcriptase zinc-binding domain-containing protein [Helianthus annuus]|uniref:Reverse transcriptase zinc-binding domain-containing protein n=1 Tax=Helianthus annuus TaxID=4232 RepID=A0A9K3DEP0_HELAN|nr:putative reverse transcriptase zinc-binding domain-containing protein [Helianthus annuus]
MWTNWVPLKCNIHAWRAETHRLPTRIELEKRNICVGSTTCVLCEQGSDSTLYLVTACILTAEIWWRIASWCKIPFFFFFFFAFDIRDLLNIYKGAEGGSRDRKIVHGIAVVTLWSIWLARNDKLFNGKNAKVMKVAHNIKSRSFFLV